MTRQHLCTPGVVVLLLLAAAAAALNCSIAKLPTGSFSYRLSEMTSPPRCSTCWEDRDRNVIARDSTFNKTLVENLTDESIDLKTCRNHLRHRTECFTFERDVDCRGEFNTELELRVNCSVLEADGFPPRTRVFRDKLMEEVSHYIPPFWK